MVIPEDYKPTDYKLTWADSTGGYGESCTHYVDSNFKTYDDYIYRTGTDPYKGNTTAYPEYGYQHCWHRLPCGVCRMTNQPCPYPCGHWEVNWEVTC